jgi:hypothetical protein
MRWMGWIECWVKGQCAHSNQEMEKGLKDVHNVPEVVVLDELIVRHAASQEENY